MGYRPAEVYVSLTSRRRIPMIELIPSLSLSLVWIVLADIVSAQARNRPFAEIKTIVENRAKEFMDLHSDKSRRAFNLDAERKKDQYSHFVLRLAFGRS
jgi:hypothetical protein